MGYNVVWTPDARHDLDVAVSYLADNLDMCAAATGLLDSMEKLVGTLRCFPEAYERSRDQFLAARGYWKAVDGGYIVPYLIDDARGEVVITNIVHGSRDYARRM